MHSVQPVEYAIRLLKKKKNWNIGGTFKYLIKYLSVGIVSPIPHIKSPAQKKEKDCIVIGWLVTHYFKRENSSFKK